MFRNRYAMHFGPARSAMLKSSFAQLRFYKVNAWHGDLFVSGPMAMCEQIDTTEALNLWASWDIYKFASSWDARMLDYYQELDARKRAL